MGIVNVTPDSFSGDGLADAASGRRARARAVERGRRPARHRRRVDAARDTFRSTRPAEIARVVPVIREVRRATRRRRRFRSTRTKPGVVRAARAAGADLVNSVWGASDELLDAVAELEMPIVATHNQHGTRLRRARRHGRGPRRFWTTARRAPFCAASIAGAHHPRSGNRVRQDRRSEIRPCCAALDRVVALGFPTMLGTSRKVTIGRLTGREPARPRVRHGRDDRACRPGGDRRRARARRRGGARRRSRSPMPSCGIGGRTDGPDNA